MQIFRQMIYHYLPKNITFCLLPFQALSLLMWRSCEQLYATLEFNFNMFKETLSKVTPSSVCVISFDIK